MTQQDIIEQFRLCHKEIDMESVFIDYNSEGHHFLATWDYNDCGLEVCVTNNKTHEILDVLNGTISEIYDIIWDAHRDWVEDSRDYYWTSRGLVYSK